MKWTIVALVALPIFALAQNIQPVDQARQQRATRLAEQLRCLVCQNQSIADSNAELAVDLRRQIDEQISLGRSDGEIVDFMVQRYGDFVLYKPPVKPTTLLLWFGPLLLLLLGGGILLHHLRRRRELAEPAPLSDEEHRAAAKLLDAGRESRRE